MTITESINRFWDNEAQPALEEFIRLPAKSSAFDPHWETHGCLLRACELASNWLQRYFPEARCEIIQSPGKTPCLFVEIDATDATNESTIAFYGHLDKQPEAQGWDEGLGPWEPVVRGDRLFGRGASDDGYSVFAMGTIVHTLKDNKLAHPRIVGIFETQEESGSLDLCYHLTKLKERIGKAEAFFVLDNHCGDYEHLWINTSLRGVISGTLTVQALKHAVHSGSYSGLVPDVFGVAQALLARIHDPVTGVVKIAECQTDLPDLRRAQIEETARFLGDSTWNHAPLLAGTHIKPIDNTAVIIDTTWKPALTVIGLDGLPRTDDAGNVVTNRICLRLSMRIPPNIDLEAANTTIARTLTANIPYGCQATWSDCDVLPGWSASSQGSHYEHWLSEAALVVFKKPALFMGQGGSIGFIPLFEKLFPTSDLLLIGALGPDSNAHAPNESLNLTYVKQLIEVMARVLNRAIQGEYK